jgi:ABC-type nitrate/sulfonate/bicarbonate transport system ATPase subunit
MDVGARKDFLRFENAGKTYVDHRYRPVHAVEGVDFSVVEGEFVSLVGPSGCGKSTLLRMAAGLASPTTGTVYFEGEPIRGPGHERGFVFQSYSAFPWLTVRQNVAFGLKDDPLAADKVNRWLSEMGLVDFADAYPKALSGGMRQRLAIARALIVEPKLLLMDEPFGALDEQTRQSMQELIIAVARNRCTVLFVTHDIREAVLLSQRIVVLSARPGRVLDIARSTLPEPRSRKQFRTEEFDLLYQSIADRWQSEPSGIDERARVRR